MQEPVEVIPVPILPWGMINAFIVRQGRRAIVVDAGTPGSVKKFERALTQAGLSFADVELIVVTHAHIDHAGSAARLREITQAPIVAHCGDMPHYCGQEAMDFCPTSLFARLFLALGPIRDPYESFEPDIVLGASDTLDLGEYGIRGHVTPTLGHTAGSVSVLLDGGDALVGDLLASGILLGGVMFSHRAKRPPFEDDPHAVGRELQRLVGQGFERFHIGHGRTLPRAEVGRHAESLLAM
ncbi:MAG: MBL fold metallo-hydrolase [Nannocystales bacterium]